MNDDLRTMLLDCCERNNTIAINLLRAIPKNAWQVKAMEGSPTVAQLFMHMHYVRLVFISENASEIAVHLPETEWGFELDPNRMEQMLRESAALVREAVDSRLTARRQMDLHFDNPALLIQHMIWHDGYHHGQIKLVLKLAGQQISDKEIGRATWGIWMDKHLNA